MKKYLAMLLLVLLVSNGIGSAEGLFSGLMEPFGGLFGNEQADDALPPLNGSFSDETVKVKINGKTLHVHADFKAALDEYERFFEEYERIMTDDDPDLLAYSDFLLRSADVMAALSAVDEDALSEDDALYYADVMLRISALLLTDD